MSPVRFEDLPGWARELIETAPVARLGLLDSEDRPRVMPVTFALAGATLVTAVDRHKPKGERELARVRWLRRRAEVALTVDRYSDDWARLAWVQALGRAAVLDEPPPGALEALAAKYAPYRDSAPEGPFVAIRTERFVCWRASG